MRILIAILLLASVAYGESPDSFQLGNVDPYEIVSLGGNNVNYGVPLYNPVMSFTKGSGVTLNDLYFTSSGTNGTLNTPDAISQIPSGTSPYTWACWYKLAGRSSNPASGLVVVYERRSSPQGASYTFVITGTNGTVNQAVTAKHISSGVDTNCSVSGNLWDGSWHLVSESYNGTSSTMQFDKTFVTCNISTWAGVTSGQPIWWMGESDGTRHAPGPYYHPRYWTRALSQAEMMLNYETELNTVRQFP